MGKASWISRFWERRTFFIRFGGTFLALLGVPSAVLTILGKHLSEKLSSWLVLAALALSWILNRRRWRQPHLLVNDILPVDFDTFRRKVIQCPGVSHLSHQVGVLAQRVYGDASITPEHYKPLLEHNKYILACLAGPDGDFLGYFDVIPLRESFAEVFLLGQVSERDLTKDNILSPGDMRSCRSLYLSGLAAVAPNTPAGMKNACILTWALLKYLDIFYGAARPLVLASAVTKQGEKLLQKFKLHLDCEGTHRRDKHPMYTMRLSHDEIAKRLACLPDYTSLCALDWVPDDSSNVIAMPRRHKPTLPHAKLYRVAAPTTSVRKSASW